MVSCAALIVFGVPLIGFLWELLVGLLCRKNCWLLSLPVLAGALGLALCLLAQSSLSLSFLLGFWAAYGCALLFGWSLSQLRTTGDLRWKKWICRGMALCSGAALAVGFGVLILHEMRAANYTMVEEVISEENALSEIPELAITDTDRKILSALEASSSVQAAIGEGDKVTINGLVPAGTRGCPEDFVRISGGRAVSVFRGRHHRAVRRNRHFVL